MKGYVIDASVAVRFLLKEDLSAEAEAVLEGFVMGRFDLFAPPLILCEVGNAIRTAAVRDMISFEAASEAYDFFLRLGLGRTVIPGEEYGKVLDLCLRRKMSFYDGVYVYLSGVLNAPLLSADDKMCEAAAGETSVVHLRDFVKV